MIKFFKFWFWGLKFWCNFQYHHRSVHSSRVEVLIKFAQRSKLFCYWLTNQEALLNFSQISIWLFLPSKQKELKQHSKKNTHLWWSLFWVSTRLFHNTLVKFRSVETIIFWRIYKTFQRLPLTILQPYLMRWTWSQRLIKENPRKRLRIPPNSATR